MFLTKLDVLKVRNLESVGISCHPKANIIYGANGSGKTSLLEAIFLLGRGRSFKHRDLRLVVNKQSDQLVVSAKVFRPASETTHQLGVMRTAKGDFEARCDGKSLQSAAELALELPIQLVDAHSFSLLEGGPLQRRQFLDWGVFHVEHGYSDLWRRFQKVLKQRNQLLRHGRIDEDSLRIWTAELIPLNEQITEYRKQYLSQLEQHIVPVVERFGGLGVVSLEYSQGWSEGAKIAEIFDGDRERDLATGTTSHGAHRADIRVFVDGMAAADRLSRGQSKLLVYALKLAQASQYQAATGQSCVFLLDDLPAELDADNRNDVVSYLDSLGCQYFVTGVDKQDFNAALEGMDGQLFHVEQGVVSNG
ncbi:MAG: DNA replication/repair protein RecF [Porticoccaceae bacterium]|nr:DNA replication/repair protein RecF [Porticoccaceae bacterium]